MRLKIAAIYTPALVQGSSSGFNEKTLYDDEKSVLPRSALCSAKEGDTERL